MSELEEKINSLMNNPQLMQQIAAMAQSITINPTEQDSGKIPPSETVLPDPGMIQLLSKAAGQTTVDSNQKALLHALSPYLSTGRVQKLERAMRAAKLAGTASLFLNSGGLKPLSGR